jgi:hypothetical protein
MALPSLTSDRGQATKYFSQKDTFGDTSVANYPSFGFNDPQNGDSADESTTPEGKEAVTAATITALNADAQKKTDIDLTAGVHNVNLSYNPITDQFKVAEGEYVL